MRTARAPRAVYRSRVGDLRATPPERCLPPASYACYGPKGCTFAHLLLHVPRRSVVCMRASHRIACVAVCARVRQQLCFRVKAWLRRTRRLAWKGRVTQTVLTSLDPANPSLELRVHPSLGFHRQRAAAEPHCTVALWIFTACARTDCAQSRRSAAACFAFRSAVLRRICSALYSPCTVPYIVPYTLPHSTLQSTVCGLQMHSVRCTAVRPRLRSPSRRIELAVVVLCAAALCARRGVD